MAVSVIMLLHIGAGSAALLSGATALATSKGSRPHRMAGNVFFVSMLIMASLGAFIAIAEQVAPSLNSVAAGLASYLVVTSWLTVKRKEGTVGGAEFGALLLGLGVAGISLYFAWMAKTAVGSTMFGVFCGVTLLAVAFDVRVIARGGISGAARIGRHLWRMCFAMLLATNAFFVGQSDVFPEAVQQSRVLLAPVLAVIALMVFWMIRVRFTKWWREPSSAIGPNLVPIPSLAVAET